MTTPELKLGSSKPLTRRDYFIGCALEALVRNRPMEGSIDRIANEAISIGAAVETKLVAAEGPGEAKP